jgi:transaldolase
MKETRMTKIHELTELGQAIWLDYIRRSFIQQGNLQAFVDKGLRGVTSNPSIFEKAIAQSDDYDEQLEKLAQAGRSTDEIYTQLAVQDIQRAADVLRPVYDATEGADGFVSLEVDPTLAHETQATIDEAARLWELVERPNLMIKIPATKEGLPAISKSITNGLNINVTLIFSLARYGEVMAAYVSGLEMRQRAGNPIDHISSVASFFVSRVDTKVDKRLEAVIQREGPQAELAASLRGQAAVANAKMAYRQFKTVFEREGFKNLQEKGARLQRPLWASTSTKNPAYSDIKYVQELIAPHTVNTLPEKTLNAFMDHGEVKLTLEDDINKAEFVLQSLEDVGISMQAVTQELEDEGVEAFAKSFRALIERIGERRQKIHPQAEKQEEERL